MSDLRAPTSVKELRSFLGVVGYYQKFIPNLQMKCAPLHGLLKKGVKWLWTPECEQSFQELKMQLTASDTLVFYDPELQIILTTDISDVGISTVITHRYSDNTERPIAYMSAVLSDTEKSYSVIEREALMLIYGVQKFQHYLLGGQFTMCTDHKPLETIFGADRSLPKVAHNRLDRWAVILSGYDYDIQYVTGQANHTADLLSWLPSNDKPSTLEKAANRMHLLHLCMKDLPITPKELKNQTISDKTLAVSSLIWLVVGQTKRHFHRNFIHILRSGQSSHTNKTHCCGEVVSSCRHCFEQLYLTYYMMVTRV